MRRKHQVLKTTTNSREYKIAYRQVLDKNLSLCQYCHPNKGCNYWNSRHITRNWKEYRRHQWK